MDVYRRFIPCMVDDMKGMFGMDYNTLKDNLKMVHHPKLNVLLKIFFGWFPEMEGHVFPDVSGPLVKRLSPSELQARIFAACLDDKEDRMREIGTLLLDLADKKIPPLSELEILLKKEKPDKKRH